MHCHVFPPKRKMFFDSEDDDDLDIIYSGKIPQEQREHSIQMNREAAEVVILSESETASVDLEYSGDDDLDAPPRVKTQPSQSQSRTSRGQGQSTLKNSSPLEEKVCRDYGNDFEVKGKEVKVRTNPQRKGMGERIVMTDDEDEDEYERWKREREKNKQAKRKRTNVDFGASGSGGGGSISGKNTTGNDVMKRQRLSVDKGNRPVVGKRPTVAGRSKYNVVVGRRPGATITKKARMLDGDQDLEESLSYLPEHLQKRKEIIDLAHKMANERAALKLPPLYEDVDFSDDDRLEELAERPAFSTIKPPGKYEDIHMNTSLGIIPAPIAQWLRDYQVKGIQFLHECFIYQRGSILGDDMGLGKTVQVIAFLTAAFGKTGDERDKKRMRKMRRLGGLEEVWYPRVLIVCPGTLMENWKSELDTWGWWTYDTYHGSKDDKASALRSAQNGLTEIMITTYNTYKIGRDAINMIPWDCVVADECHIIKERKSDITKAMNDVNALCRIGLTGTAIQNKYEELWTLLNWCNPGSVGPPSIWNKTISRPLRLGQAHDATSRQLGNARRIAHQLVTNLLPRMFLRRMKSLIAEQLPKKSDRVVFCPLTKTQAEAYEKFCDSENVILVKYSGKICDCGSGKKRGYCCYKENEEGKSWRELVFPCIQNILKLCNHIANWIPLNEESPDKRSEKLNWLQECLPDDWRRLVERPPLENYMDPELCGKWVVLQKLLSFWHTNGDKVLIFSHSIKLLNILRCLFANTSYNVEYLDGAMPLEDRAHAVSSFNGTPDSFIFLISTRAGGVGLNITSANKVVIFDPSWNPSHDLQAQDRAYRLGQRRDVEVFRLVSAGTIEEIVYARQIYKQQQANIGYGASTERRYFTGVMGEEGRKGELFGLVNMFTFQGEDGGPGGMLVKEVVNKTNVAEGRMGVRVIGYDAGEGVADDNEDDVDEIFNAVISSEDNEDENTASQLEAMSDENLGQKRKRKKRTNKGKDMSSKGKMNPVQAILEAAGVQYTHENSEVLGSSAIEARISKQAVEAATRALSGDTSAFGEREGNEETADGAGRAREEEGIPVLGEGEDTVELNGITYQFHPPEDVQRRQFCEMSRVFGFGSAREFALVVEGWTPTQRRKALEKFYRILRERGLERLRKGKGEKEHEAVDSVKEQGFGKQVMEESDDCGKEKHDEGIPEGESGDEEEESGHEQENQYDDIEDNGRDDDDNDDDDDQEL